MFLFIFLIGMLQHMITDIFTMSVQSAHVNLAPITCVHNPEYKIQIVTIDDKTKPLGWPNNWSNQDIDDVINEANSIVHNSSDNAFRYQQLNIANDNCKISVIHYDISEIKDYTTTLGIYSIIQNDFNLYDAKTKYIILDSYLNFACGVGSLYTDDQPGPENKANGNGIAILSCKGGFVLIHEIFHTLGAVQKSAPHSNGYGHCTDGLDVMCYPEHGIKVDMICDIQNILDCNHDDYYSLNVKPDSYLSDHWNVANSLYLTTYYRTILPLIFKIGNVH